jgi:hypothetical protein
LRILSRRAGSLGEIIKIKGVQMESKAKHSRRKVLKIGMTALAVAPLAGLSERAFATQNTAVRKALKYQLQPNGEKHCAVCVNFIPNKDKPNNDADVNGCKLYPGDIEICPHCYCTGFVQNPAATKAGASWSPWAPAAK